MSILIRIAWSGAAVLLVALTSLGVARPAHAADPHTLNLALIGAGDTCNEAAAKGANTVAGTTADGTQAITLCAHAELTAGAVDAAGIPIVFTVSQGVVSTGTAKSVTVITSGSGVASTAYRGGGNIATTDTAIVSYSAGNAVATESIALTAPSGNTATAIKILAPSVQSIAATVTNTSPNYQSPQTGADVSIQVTDANGLGVNGQVVLVSVDRGAVVANPGFATTTATACNGATARSVTATTGSNPASRGAGTNTAGIINLTVCGNQTDAAGRMTLTAQNVSTSMANATASIAMAGRPAKITATATGNTITATVTDQNDNRVADGTPVRFTMSQNAGAVSTSCATTTNGTASSVAALVQATGTVLVSADWNETGAAATCAAPGAQQIATSVAVPGGSGGTGGTGSGQITSGSIPQGGGFGLIVFGGGTIQQLVSATGCPVASMALWATIGGNFVTYVPGTTIGAVNADFMAAFPNGVIPAGTPFIGKCR